MNTSEPDHSPSGPTGLQVELGSRPKPYRFVIWLVPLLVLVAGSVTLFAWLPNSSPTLSPSPTSEYQSTSSTVPPLIWSPDSIELILSPGESASRSITFTSSIDLANVVLEPVPTIAPFLTIKPNTFSRVRANRPEKVQISFAIPPTATLGNYAGTIRLRSGDQTLPATLKVGLSIWNAFVDPRVGMQFKYPPTWTVRTLADGLSLSSNTPSNTLEGSTSGNEITVLWLSSNGFTDLEAWLQDHYSGEIDISQTPLSRYLSPLGVQWLQLSGAPDLHASNVVSFSMRAGQVLQVGLMPVGGFEEVYLDVLSTLTLN